MTPIAPHMSAFLRERLPLQRGASEHTCDSYAYAFQLLFQFASARLQLTPSALSLEQLDAPLIMEFLHYLETERHNSPRTRNARLVAIKSFMRFIEYRVPSLLEHSRRILAIPAKKTDIRRHCSRASGFDMDRTGDRFYTTGPTLFSPGSQGCADRVHTCQTRQRVWSTSRTSQRLNWCHTAVTRRTPPAHDAPISPLAIHLGSVRCTTWAMSTPVARLTSW